MEKWRFLTFYTQHWSIISGAEQRQTSRLIKTSSISMSWEAILVMGCNLKLNSHRFDSSTVTKRIDHEESHATWLELIFYLKGVWQTLRWRSRLLNIIISLLSSINSFTARVTKSINFPFRWVETREVKHKREMKRQSIIFSESSPPAMDESSKQTNFVSFTHPKTKLLFSAKKLGRCWFGLWHEAWKEFHFKISIRQ